MTLFIYVDYEEEEEDIQYPISSLVICGGQKLFVPEKNSRIFDEFFRIVFLLSVSSQHPRRQFDSAVAH